MRAVRRKYLVLGLVKEKKLFMTLVTGGKADFTLGSCSSGVL